MKPKLQKGKKLVHSGKKKVMNEYVDEDENCVFILFDFCIYIV